MKDDNTNPFGGQPVGEMDDNPPMPTFPSDAIAAPVKKSRKKLWLWVSIVGVIVLAGGGLATWWFAFYNNDAMILRGAFDNLVTSEGGIVTAKATISSSADDVPFNTVSLDVTATVGAGNASQVDIAADVDADDFDVAMNASLLADLDNDAVYVKVENVDDLANIISDAIVSLQESEAAFSGETLTAAQRFAIEELVDDIAGRVDGQWIRITVEDATSLVNINSAEPTDDTEINPDGGIQGGLSGAINTVDTEVETAETDAVMLCLTNFGRKITDDADFRDDLYETIRAEEFIDIARVGKDDDGIEYELTLNADNAERFGRNLVASTPVQEVVNCFEEAGVDVSTDDLTTDDSDDAAAFDGEVSFHFWVDRGSRQARKAELRVDTAEYDLTLTLGYDYEVPAAPAIPTDAVDVEEFVDEVFGTSAL